MNGVIAFLVFVVVVGTLIFVPPLAAPYETVYGPVTLLFCAKALGVCATVAVVSGVLIRRVPSYGRYLLKLFLFALLVRMVIGTCIFVFNGQDFFGGDAWTYDFFGAQQVLAWGGDKYAQINVDHFTGTGFASAWGMLYIVGVIYGVIGRNMLAIQFFNSVLGAATAPVIFLCAEEVFKNHRVAKVAGLAVAFYPSLVLWSSQGLKDGPIVFFLALCILATLKLGQKFSASYLLTLTFSLIGVVSFRFYVFYMLIAAIGGSFLIGMRTLTAQSIARQFVVVLVMGLSLTYLGVLRSANAQLEQYGNLEQLNRSRQDQATSGGSGFAQDVDVSTTSGALMTIPTGLVYLLFAPFPWQLGSLRQSLTLPEMVIWWAAFPLLILGVWFSLKYRLRQMSPILIFTSMLTLAYSVFQGNVGTAYRQRAQLLVFYFIFVAVGSVLVKEKRDARRRRAAEELRRATLNLKAGLISPQQRA
ncbi:MAG TPA: glycosyltransferase family 39 protein [Pyrinomonadaceae bacterium]|nr:glycosyltransferase family 39 protein [Pyrinomonadaceae bacterium]